MSGLKFGIREAVVTIIAFFVIAAMYIIYVVYAPFTFLSTNCYQYPGNGFEYFSVNRRIADLEKDIGDYSYSIPGVRKEAEKVVFHNVTGYQFKSPREIAPGEFSLEIKLAVENGQCNIGIGNIHLKVRDKKLIVENWDDVVFKGDTEIGNSIIVDHFRNSKGELRISIITNGIPINMPHQKLESPGFITIELSDGFTGEIGPWVWRRG